MGKKNWFKQEFQVCKLKFEHDAPEEFVVSQWQDESVNWIHLTYRWLIALFFLCLLIVSWALQQESPELWLIYLTHWGIMCCCLQTLLGAVLVTFRVFKIRQLGSVPYYDQMPNEFKFYWASQTATITVAFGISIIYWTLLHRPEMNSAMNFMTHGMNSLLMLLDLFIVAHPTRLLHVYLPICIAIVYVIFSAIYFWAGGLDPHGNHFIYNILDWDNPGPAMIVVFGGLILIIFLHLLIFLIYRLRLMIHYKLNKNSMMVLPVSTISGRTNMAFTSDKENEKS